MMVDCGQEYQVLQGCPLGVVELGMEWSGSLIGMLRFWSCPSQIHKKR